jgi:hypothetical protein
LPRSTPRQVIAAVIRRRTILHFKVIVTVRLDEPMPVSDECEVKDEGLSEVTGYVIAIGVNAPDQDSAVSATREVALNPEDEDGQPQPYNGTIESIEVEQIEKADWDPDILRAAVNIDNPGVYYSSGLILFNHADDKKWWQFWK